MGLLSSLAHPSMRAVTVTLAVCGCLDFTQFLKAIQMQREIEKRQDNEADFLAAFVAMVRDATQRTARTTVMACPSLPARRCPCALVALHSAVLVVDYVSLRGCFRVVGWCG